MVTYKRDFPKLNHFTVVLLFESIDGHTDIDGHKPQHNATNNELNAFAQGMIEKYTEQIDSQITFVR